jgi:hypothetical protein
VVERRQSAAVVAGTHPLAVGALTAVAVSYVALVDPNRPGHYPGCPFRALTGYYCPGCGGLRAVHEMTHGHLQAALSSNLVVVLAVPVVLVLWASWTRDRLLHRTTRLRAPSWLLSVIGIGLIAFWVLRNLSGMHWLAP